MPDLPDDLRALLHERAEHAAAVPAPSEALVRRVRRRRAARATLAVTASAAGVVALGLGAAAMVPAGRTATPAATPAPTLTPDATPGGKYEFCTDPELPRIDVAVHATEQKFAHGCYRVSAVAGTVTFRNPQTTKHDLVIKAEGSDRVLYQSELVATGGTTDRIAQFARGDYTLTCSIHPAMHAQLVIR